MVITRVGEEFMKAPVPLGLTTCSVVLDPSKSLRTKCHLKEPMVQIPYQDYHKLRHIAPYVSFMRSSRACLTTYNGWVQA